MEKGVLELRRAATMKPRKIERSGFFLLDHNGRLRKVKKFNGMFPTKKNSYRKKKLIWELCAPPWRIGLIKNYIYDMGNENYANKTSTVKVLQY